MIHKITIKDEASFDNTGVEMNDLKKINIIYGANGTGKSTISRILANADVFPQSEIIWDDGTPIDVLVYNKDFCEKNYQEQMPGVFTLGEATSEVLKEINEKKAKLEELNNNGSNYKSDIDKQQNNKTNEINSFRESAWNDLLKKYESHFPKSSIGGGTKDAFVSKLLAAHDAKSESALPLDDLITKAKTLFGNQPVKHELIELLNHDEIRTIESNPIWQKVIVGKQDIDIADLIMRLGCSDWVRQGLHYIEDENDVCPFCQQHTISRDFKDKVNSFFDENYNNDIATIQQLNERYIATTSSVAERIENVLRDQKSKGTPFADLPALDSALSTLQVAIAGNIELISSKKKEPSRRLSLSSTDNVLIDVNNIIGNANATIAENNRIADNFTDERSKLVNDIWNFYANSYSATIDAYSKKLKGIDKAIQSLNGKVEEAKRLYRETKAELIKLENTVTSVTPTVNEINRLLCGYGFTNFQIKDVPEKKDFYQIVRENGEPASLTLSEGERTFITFLYYMQLVKGSYSPDGVTNNRVLVIDDPVSSLDSNILFVVSTLLRDMFQDIHAEVGNVKQIILLTHNVYFHKEIAFSNSRDCKWRDCIAHWILRKRDNVSSIQCYGKENPIKSSYELMWTEIKNNGMNSCIVLQNIMRRIIENYFKIFGGISPDTILDKFTGAEDKMICRSLLSWVNDGSHSLPEDLFVEMSDDQIGRYKEVFHQIFIKMGQEAHYDMMMQSAGENED